MPELPEVETIRRGLQRRIVRRTITAVEVRNPWVIRGNPESFSRGLEGRFINSLCRKGKTLAMNLHSGDGRAPDCLIIRLGMTGQIVVVPREAPLLPHTHVRLVLGDGSEELRYRDPRRFGMLRYCSAQEAGEIFDSLGPDALQITEVQLREALRGRRGSIKGWLLNQQMLAGLGNIYADEALFEARIHPQSPAGKISRPSIHLLYRAIVRVLRHAINRQGTSFRDYIDIEGRRGNFESRLRVYHRTGCPCRRCGKLIQRVTVCGRSTHFCSRCQRRRRRIAPPGRPRQKRSA